MKIAFYEPSAQGNTNITFRAFLLLSASEIEYWCGYWFVMYQRYSFEADWENARFCLKKAEHLSYLCMRIDEWIDDK